MLIIVNGFEEDVERGTNLAALIEEFQEQESGLIVEVNGRFIYSEDYETYEVQPGDKVEMIHPAFGG